MAERIPCRDCNEDCFLAQLSIQPHRLTCLANPRAASRKSLRAHRRYSPLQTYSHEDLDMVREINERLARGSVH